MAKPAQGVQSGADPETTSPQPTKEKARREIPGNLVYLTSYGALKNVLLKIITASVPDKFSQDFLSTVLGYSGGSYKQVIPILKRIGFITGDGKPTEIYSKFRTESGRPLSAYNALRTGFSELFKRNEHIYAANDQKLTDHIVEVTGLTKSDPVVGAIKGTFRVLSNFLPSGFSPSASSESQAAQTEGPKPDGTDSSKPNLLSDEKGSEGKLNLAYNINIVLPDTKDIEVFNAIFRSIRDNLMR